MYLQITNGRDYSSKGESSARDFIDLIPPKDLRMVVGLPYYMPCQPGCVNCVRDYNKRLDRIKETADLLGLDIKFHEATHLKYYRIGDRIFTGGINLTSSQWTDVAMEVTDPQAKKELKIIFEQNYYEAGTDIEQYKLTSIPGVDEITLKDIIKYAKIAIEHDDIEIGKDTLQMLVDLDQKKGDKDDSEE
jgi:hypothetical protein